MNVNLSDFKVGLIATMPRSGTWYNHYFFHFYDQLLRGKTNIAVEIPLDPVNRKDTIGLDIMLISHTICPGFNCYQGQYREAWDKLDFYVEGFNLAANTIEADRQFFDPTLNKNVRIVYFYRNPLDQAVSFFRHAQNHKEPQHKHRKDSQGNLVLMTSVGEYLHHVGLEAYMKQFLTFKLMKALYPENILLLTYESLVRNPKATFLSVLNHFGHDIGNPVHLTTMEKALTLSSQKSMKQIENLVGHALADDQIERNGSHIRDGSTGQWKALLNSDDLGKIQQRLEDFGLSLADFEVE